IDSGQRREKYARNLDADIGTEDGRLRWAACWGGRGGGGRRRARRSRRGLSGNRGHDESCQEAEGDRDGFADQQAPHRPRCITNGGGLENFYSSLFRRRRAPAPLTNAGARYDLLRALQPMPRVAAETDEPRTQEEQGPSLGNLGWLDRRRHAHLSRRSIE